MDDDLSPPEDWAALLHDLNQRYRREWERAQRLQDELDNVRGSRAWRVLDWLRRVKRRLWPATPPPADPNGEGVEILDLPPGAPTGRVSVLVPFRDRCELLRDLVRGLRRTAYRRFEVVLIDNGSTCPRTLNYVRRLARRRGVRLVRSPGPFNFARLCNGGAARARGDYLLFLNNDVQVTDPAWLGHLVHLANRPAVGVAGATLLYPDGTLQHAGIVPDGAGGWRHAYRGRPAGDPGHYGELSHPRAVPAVTGACLLIGRGLFRELGGFDEGFPVTGNDVDLCLRVRGRGLVAAVTPHARLLHFESLTRGYALDPTPLPLARPEVS